MQTLNSITELKWQDIRQDLSKVNPELAHIIDEINPSKEYTIFKAAYTFGSEILQKGQLHIPDKRGYLIPLKDSKIKNITDKLGYNLGTNPVSIITENTAEIFVVFDQHTIPLYGLLPSGKIFGTWRVLSQKISHTPTFLWDMTAGARSIFILSRISDTVAHKRLTKKFQLDLEKPMHMLHHWNTFKSLANHHNFDSPWQLTILFFTKKWFENLNDPSWTAFEHYLLRAGWNGSEFWRNKSTWDAVFSLIQKRLLFKPNPYDADTVKHLIGIAAGVVPGFAPAIDNFAGPIKRIQEIYAEIYQTKYDPVIMQPYFYSLYEPQRPVYYSLQYPSSMEFSPKSIERKSVIGELHMIHSLLKKYLHELVKGDFNIQSTPFYDVTQLAQFDCFHVGPENYSEIRNAEIISSEDLTFKSLLQQGNYNNVFPVNSPFLKGCIRVSPKNKLS